MFCSSVAMLTLGGFIRMNSEAENHVDLSGVSHYCINIF